MVFFIFFMNLVLMSMHECDSLIHGTDCLTSPQKSNNHGQSVDGNNRVLKDV